MMGKNEYLSGIEGENRACEFLINNGYEILSRNFSCRYGEIDIIAKKNEILHFVEVKFSNKNYDTEYRVTNSKISKLLKTIEIYMSNENLEDEFQLDLIAINSQKINFIKNFTF